MFSGLSKSRTSSISSLAEIDVGDRVIVAGQRKGTVKFVGDTKFAPGKKEAFFLSGVANASRLLLIFQRYNDSVYISKIR